MSFEGTAGGWDLCHLDAFFPKVLSGSGQGLPEQASGSNPTRVALCFLKWGALHFSVPLFQTVFPPVFLSPTFPSSLSKHALTSDPRKSAFWMAQDIKAFKLCLSTLTQRMHTWPCTRPSKDVSFRPHNTYLAESTNLSLPYVKPYT